MCFFVEKAVRLSLLILLLGVLIPAMACGGSGSAAPQGGSLSGNWQITLNGQAPPAVALTGFLIQSGGSVTGNLLQGLISNCSGVGSVTGTVNGQNVSLNINQSGATIGLTGSASAASMSGEFTSQPGTCSFIPNSGTWSAVQVVPISGSFHGAFTSREGNGTVAVTGTLNQGPNTGSSTATLSGTLTTTSATTFCSYVLPGTITGLISGTQVQMSLYGENGLEYAQLGNVGGESTTVTPDGTSLSGGYAFAGISAACPSDQGTFELSFP